MCSPCFIRSFCPLLSLGALVLAACGSPGAPPRAPTVSTSGGGAAAPSPTVASPPAASAPEPTADDLARTLAGPTGGDGVFWIPTGGFDFEDLLLEPDGSYVTHLHARPGASGRWRLEGRSLVLSEWMGDGEWTLRDIRATRDELEGTNDGKRLTFRRARR